MLNVIAREMVAIKRSFLLMNLELSHHVYPEKNGRKCFTTTSAKKKESSESPRSQEQPLFPLRAPKNLLSQSAVAVFGLGFIDAGYSGDWSRIGVISKESEDLLKVAAFVVIPLCVFLIFSISKKEQA
ncbi:DNA-DIRECTED RNA polymerase SUBUNIT BETA [Salix koriyanagi]|uniref:DNA-DIRECTED RNA polymerase SUBUNIT BETA n=1 Tax=Salix koriyanagi TaxID=2511006 RepID=A0A9Q0VCJ2_9ROSI|nr:DNA-DIRECTED RNA polymerase SUBUNIT BETA [Salix koriyanagi]